MTDIFSKKAYKNQSFLFFLKILKRASSYFDIILYFISSSAVVIIEMIVLFLFTFSYNIVSKSKLDSFSNKLFTNYCNSNFKVVIAAIVVVLVVRFLIFLINTFLQNKIVGNTYIFYFKFILERFIKTNFENRNKQEEKIINNLLIKDIRDFSQTYILLNLERVLQLVMLLIFLSSILFIDYITTGLIIVLAVIFYLIVKLFRNKITLLGGKLLENDALLVDETHYMLKNNKSYFCWANAQEYFFKRINKLFNKSLDYLLENTYYSNFPQKIVESFIFIAFAFFLYSIHSGLISFSNFILISLVILRCVPIVNRLNTVRAKIQNSEKLAYFVNHFYLKFSQIEQKNSVEINNSIEIINYDINIFQSKLFHIDGYEFKSGSSYFIYGKSGIGKSTFIDSLVGYRNIENGLITIDQKKIIQNTYNLSNVLYIEQKMGMINSNLIENVTLGSDFDQNKFDEIVKIVGIEALVLRTINNPQNNEDFTSLNLSGGETQRVLIARALYNMSTLLIFDEATNAIDSESEARLVSDVIDYVFKNKCIIIFISHNVSLSRLFTKSINFNEFVYIR